MNISKAIRAGAVLLVATLAAAGCTSDSEELPGGEEPAGAVAVTEKAQWSADRLGIATPAAATLRGDVALVAGGVSPSISQRLVAADADTGKVRWVADSAGYLGQGIALEEEASWVETGALHTLGSGADWSVLVEYAAAKENPSDEIDVAERGVAALSGKDGRVQWKQRLSVGKGSQGTDIRLRDVQDGTVLVAVEDRSGTATTYALDANADGRKLWQHSGEVGHFAGELVLGQHPIEDDLSESSEVFALDARSGKKRWSLADEYDASALHGAVDGRALVSAEKGSETGRGPYRVLDTRTGEVTDPLDDEGGDPSYGDCKSEAELLACPESSEAELLTIRGGKHNDVVRSEVDIDTDGLQIWSVHADRVYLSWAETSDGDGKETRSGVVDRNGKLLREDLPGRVMAASDEHVITANGSNIKNLEMTVHRAKDGDSAPSAKPQPDSNQSPLTYAKKPQWGFVAGDERSTDHGTSVRDTDMSWLGNVDLAGDTLLYAGMPDDPKGRFEIVAANARTGKQRWKWDDGELGSGAFVSRQVSYTLVGDGDSGTLLLPYESDDGQGVAAVAVRDGETLWKKQVTENTEAEIRLRAAGEKQFLVNLSGAGEARTLSYELSKPRKQWSRKGVTGAERNGGTVVANQSKGAARDWENAPNRAVVGIDASTGKPKWETGKRYDDPAVLGTFDQAVVVRHDVGMAVLRASDGKELGRQAARPNTCSGTPDAAKNAASGPPPMLVCEVTQVTSDATLYPVSVEATADGVRIRQLTAFTGYWNFHGLGRQLSGTKDKYQRHIDEKQPEHHRVTDARGRQLATKRLGGAIAADKRHVVRLHGSLGDRSPGRIKVTVHDRK